MDKGIVIIEEDPVVDETIDEDYEFDDADLDDSPEEEFEDEDY